jgi:hypothetical protein
MSPLFLSEQLTDRRCDTLRLVDYTAGQFTDSN